MARKYKKYISCVLIFIQMHLLTACTKWQYVGIENYQQSIVTITSSAVGNKSTKPSQSSGIIIAKSNDRNHAYVLTTGHSVGNSSYQCYVGSGVQCLNYELIYCDCPDSCSKESCESNMYSDWAILKIDTKNNYDPIPMFDSTIRHNAASILVKSKSDAKIFENTYVSEPKEFTLFGQVLSAAPSVAKGIGYVSLPVEITIEDPVLNKFPSKHIKIKKQFAEYGYLVKGDSGSPIVLNNNVVGLYGGELSETPYVTSSYGFYGVPVSGFYRFIRDIDKDINNSLKLYDIENLKNPDNYGKKVINWKNVVRDSILAGFVIVPIILIITELSNGDNNHGTKGTIDVKW